MQKRTIAEIAVALSLVISLGVNVIDSDEGYIPYGCEDPRVNDMYCYKLSRVNDGGFQRNCYYDRDNSRRHKQCSTGWERISTIEETLEKVCPEVLVIAYTDDAKYFCDGIGIDANCIQDNMIELPII